MPSPSSFLVDFDLSNLSQRKTELLVIGSGAAGLSTAIEAGSRGVDVLVVSKAKLPLSNTFWAQGGIAASINRKQSSIDSHMLDTLQAGDGLCDREMIEHVIPKSAEAIDFLVESGCSFDQGAGEEYDLSIEAAHREARVLHAGGDATGAEIQRCLLARALSLESIKILEETFVVDLLAHEEECFGALLYQASKGFFLCLADNTVLASGGVGKLYRESSNPDLATGDGHSIAIRAGVVMRDLEMVQFHPTLFYIAGAPRKLVTEALRGAGAYLRNTAGERFMLRYHEQAELAPRDIVARAIESELKQRGESAVFLDLTHLDRTSIAAQFPTFYNFCQRYRVDVGSSWVPVRPGPHYMIGGVKVDIHSASSQERLYAVGEVASTGLHGANRLASNSLLEAVVMGRCLGQSVESLRVTKNFPFHIWKKRNCSSQDIDWQDLRQSFQTLMLRMLGVVREREKMEELQKRIEGWKAIIQTVVVETPPQWEICNGLELGAAMVKSALCREESRGVHYRLDFPEKKESFKRHVEYSREQGAYWADAKMHDL